MSATLLQIPVIDFEPFLTGDDAAKAAIAQQVHHACHDIGFMYLKHLNLDPDLIQRLFAQSQQFFDLPFEAKHRLAWSSEFSNRGYIGVERERLDPDKPGDLKEALNVGKELTPEQRAAAGRDALAVNRWPEELPEFRTTVLEFYSACIAAADQVLQAMAIALKQPPSFFAAAHSKHDQTLRLLHYPPLDQAPKPGQVRAGEHSDYGSITLLFQDSVGGLEVRTRSGEWIAAPAIPGAVIVNTGDLMERWTNHEFCSTKHRVRVPDDDRVQRSRQSVAFFCHPNLDAQISCIETCQGPNRPPLYPPITAGDYLLSKLQATY